MNWWQMYLLLKLDDVQGLFLGLCIMLSIALVVIVIIGAINIDMESKPFPKKLSLWVGTPALFFCLVAVTMPDTKQMAAIIIVPKVCNAVMADSSLKKIPSQITNLASEWLEELKPAHGEPASDNRPQKETSKK